MNQPIKAINPIITIQPLSTSVTNRDATGMQTILATLTDGTIIRGFVVNRDRNNNPVLRTPIGDLVVESEVFIKTGSEVVFRVDPSQASRARIITIDAMSPEEYTIQATAKGLTEDTIEAPLQISTQTTQTASQTTAATPPSPLLQAIVLRAMATPAGIAPQNTSQPLTPPAALPVPPALAQLPAGAAVDLTVIDIKLPPLPVAVQTIPQAASLSQLLPANTPAAQLTGNAPPQLQPAFSSLLPPTLAAQMPPASTSPTASPVTATAAAYTSAAGPAPAALPITALTPPVPTGAQAMPPAANAAPQMPPAANSAPASTLPVLQASVIGHGEDGSNILHTSFATLKIFTPQPLPTGTTLEIQAQPSTAVPAQNPLAAFAEIAPRVQLPLPPTFTYLTQALTQLLPGDPAITKELLAHLPTIGPKFTSGLLFFLAAVKQGDTRDLFNSRITNRLEALAPELLTRLSRDVATLHQNFIDSPFSDWKTIPLPLVFGSTVESAQLYIRDQNSEGQNGGDKGSAGQRFVLDIHFSELGPMQFDGFVRQDGSKLLELYLRSYEPLETGFSEGIRGIFENTLQAAGMNGHLVFQHGAERFVKPQARPPAAEGGGEPHTILA